MNERPRTWLLFLTIATLSTIVFVFFTLRLKPVRPPSSNVTTGKAPTVLTEPTITYVDPSRGAESPPVTIVEFGDFQCEACKELSDNLATVMRSYPDRVRLVWKDMPNENAHPLATIASVAAHCADRQGGFWAYHDQLFERQSYLTESELSIIAVDIGLNTNAFGRCLEASDTLAVVRKDFEEGQALGILATPTIFIGTESYTGALSVTELSRLIEESQAP